MRLQEALSNWENKPSKTQKERIDFYLYISQEIINKNKHSKRKNY